MERLVARLIGSCCVYVGLHCVYLYNYFLWMLHFIPQRCITRRCLCTILVCLGSSPGSSNPCPGWHWEETVTADLVPTPEIVGIWEMIKKTDQVIHMEGLIWFPLISLSLCLPLKCKFFWKTNENKIWINIL